MKNLRTVFIFWVPLFAWLAVINNLSSIPGQYLPHIAMPYADKIFHIAEYFVLGTLLIRAMDHSFPTAPGFNVDLAKMVFLAIILSLCYGAFDELIQRSVPGRSCEFLDLLADGVGSLAGVIIYTLDRELRRIDLAADKAFQGRDI